MAHIKADDGHHHQVGKELRTRAAQVIRRIPRVHAGVFHACPPSGYEAPGATDQVNRSGPDGVIDLEADEPAVRHVVQQRRHEGDEDGPRVAHRGAT